MSAPATERAPVARGRDPALPVLLGLLLAVRLLVAFAAYPRLVERLPDWAWANNDGYDRIAVRWAETGVFAGEDGRPTATRLPLYPAVNAAAVLAVGDRYPAAVMAAQALFSLGTGWLLFGMTGAAFGRGPARIALGLFILHPHVNNFIFRCATETLFLLLVTAWLFFLAQYARRPRRASMLGAGAALGLAFLTRPSLGVLPAVVFAWAFVRAVRGGREPRAAFGDVALALALAAALLAPWLARNAAQSGRFPVVQTWIGRPLFHGFHVSDRFAAFWRSERTLTDLDEEALRELRARTAAHLAALDRAALRPIEREWIEDDFARRLAWARWRAGLPRSALNALRNLALAPVVQMTWGSTRVLAAWNLPLLALAALGWRRAGRTRPEARRALAPVGLAFLYLWAAHAFVWPQARYVLPGLIPFSLYAAVELDALRVALTARARRS